MTGMTKTPADILWPTTVLWIQGLYGYHTWSSRKCISRNSGSSLWWREGWRLSLTHDAIPTSYQHL